MRWIFLLTCFEFVYEFCNQPLLWRLLQKGQNEEALRADFLCQLVLCLFPFSSLRLKAINSHLKIESCEFWIFVLFLKNLSTKFVTDPFFEDCMTRRPKGRSPQSWHSMSTRPSSLSTLFLKASGHSTTQQPLIHISKTRHQSREANTQRTKTKLEPAFREKGERTEGGEGWIGATITREEKPPQKPRWRPRYSIWRNLFTY